MTRRFLTILGYVFATAVVILGTIMLIAYGNGYSYNFKTHKLVQRGLVILNSIPSGASITFGDKHLKQKTPYRQTLEAGEYDYTLEKTGFRTWHKRIPVVPSQVYLAQYVILLANHIQVDSIGSYPGLNQFVESRDHSRVAFVVPDGPGAGIWSLNTGNHQQTRVYASAPTSGDKPAESVQLLSWSDDNSHLLVRSQVGDTISMLVVSATPGDQPINLSDTFKLDLGSLAFSLNDWHQVYSLDSDGLRRLNLNDKTVSAVLADHVGGYTFAGDRIVYVDTQTSPASLWSLDTSGRKQQLAASVPTGSSYELAYATYIGTPEVVVIAQDTRQAKLYSNIYSQLSTKAMNSPAQHAIFNGDGRFVVLTTDTQVDTYDLEQNKTYSVVIGAVTGLSWFDNYHLLFNQGTSTTLAEYDGNYATEITRNSSEPAAGSQDTKTVVVPAPTSTGGVQIKTLKIRQ